MFSYKSVELTGGDNRSPETVRDWVVSFHSWVEVGSHIHGFYIWIPSLSRFYLNTVLEVVRGRKGKGVWRVCTFCVGWKSELCVPFDKGVNQLWGYDSILVLHGNQFIWEDWEGQTDLGDGFFRTYEKFFESNCRCYLSLETWAIVCIAILWTEVVENQLLGFNFRSGFIVISIYCLEWAREIRYSAEA